MNLSVLAKWSRLDFDEEDRWQELIILYPAGCPKSALIGVVAYTGYADAQVKMLQRNDLHFEPRLAQELVLKLWEHFAAQRHSDIASEMIWIVADLTPMLRRWFYRRDEAQIARNMLAVSPVSLSPPNVLQTVID
jgi:hypothetical protein